MYRILLKAALPACILFGSASNLSAQEVERTGNIFHKAVCGFVVGHAARCHSHVITDATGRALSDALAPLGGYGPGDLRDAYKVTATGYSSAIVAIVDAYGYTNAEADLKVYRKHFGLPTCTQKNGCFRKLNQQGKRKDYPAQDLRWAGESALDLDMASAMCPDCTIYLIEANSSADSDFAAAVNTAARLGARAISNSYGGDEAGTQGYEAAYDHPGIAVIASSGDNGYGVQFPASSPHVTAVGGTHLARSADGRGWKEKVWPGSGSGCSSVYAKPAWQHDTGCPNRTVADVAADADMLTPVAIYGPDDSGQSTWQQYYGTSVAAPLIAGIYAANGGQANYGSDPYGIASRMFDVTSGRNGSCNHAYLCHGEVGYDGPTGVGTPNGNMGVSPFVTFDVPGSTGSFASAINAHGTIVGSWTDSRSLDHAFMRAVDGTIAPVDPPGSETADASSINDAGTIAGAWWDGNTHGFTRTAAGSVTSFDLGNATFTVPIGINKAGTIVGIYLDSNVLREFVRAPDGTATSFDIPEAYGEPADLAINDAGAVAGSYETRKGRSHGFIRTSDGTITTIDEPGSNDTSAVDINNSGAITGRGAHGFVRSANGTFIEFDVPGAYSTQPQSINDAGAVTGFYLDAAQFLQHGFIRAADGTIATFDVPGSSDAAPADINAGGTIAGDYITPDGGVHGFVGRP